MRADVALFDWMVPQHETVAHAFAAGHGIPFRSACENARWTVKGIRATSGPLCPACVAIVRGAANHVLDTIVGLGWVEARPFAARGGLEQYQAEDR
jgi:hypothetical protein